MEQEITASPADHVSESLCYSEIAKAWLSPALLRLQGNPRSEEAQAAAVLSVSCSSSLPPPPTSVSPMITTWLSPKQGKPTAQRTPWPLQEAYEIAGLQKMSTR